MDGTRMGSRSSTRHGPAAVFSGPVRRWKKTWAPITSSANHPTPVSSSRVLLYRWVPLSPAGAKEDGSEEQAARPTRYLPVSVVLARKKEVAKQAAEEVEAAAAETTGSDPQSPAIEKDESGDANAEDFEDEKELDDKHEGPIDIEASQEQMLEDVEKTSQPMEQEKQDPSLSDSPMQDETTSQS